MVKRDGVTVVILRQNKVLLLKRVWIPFIENPGMWYLVSGAREGNESYLANAYREINEETNIEKSSLKLLYTGEIDVKNLKRKIKWHNAFFVFSTTKATIKLNMEHTSYKWVGIKDFENSQLIGCFENSAQMLVIIKKYIKEKN